METVFISGLGLIGSSIARIIREKDKNIDILIEDASLKNTSYMLEAGIANQIVNFKQGIQKADIVFLATPVSVIKQQLNQIADIELTSEIIVTDVGSTKLSILNEAKKLVKKNKYVRFIGGHPMSGSHLTGSENGNKKLFNNALYFLVNQNAPQTHVNHLTDLLSESHAQFKELTAQEHDELVATTSHLPHVLATTLVNMANQSLENSSLGLETAANGFKKTTEIAQADEVMWQSIFLENDAIILNQIDQFEEELMQLKMAIKAGNQSLITEKIKQAKQIREQL